MILGPTASGKTALALELTERLGGEIVSLDSRQVYCLMDIGTAKPTAQERARAPHHGLDVVFPNETWTLAQHQQLTYSAIAAVRSRGKLPILVVGTGQYLRAVLEGWTVPAVPPQPELRAGLHREAEADGVEALHARLAMVDPAAARRIMSTDLRRIVRALEVFEVTGRPISEQQRSTPPPYEPLLIGLTMRRETLYRRADERAKSMVERGLIAEIEDLLNRGYDWSLPAMGSIGYAEFRPCFEARAPLHECVQRLQLNTHRFIRHQYVWFRRFQSVSWLDVETQPALAQAVPLAQRWGVDNLE
ncbi:MAG: tRNA (adenosine(37)-N6)-dimethylallyltransferase MiaA [Chloroflexota bacterium]|nr:tRNA (adenosine(37)-N6)-dimethylallyltransferase MiaA [Chloroflexota bacterium]